ncbi:hypothetical protein GGI25_005094 [Coemansia spiralis]|uniref:Uncharacterized protein n=2 Tax=Coemansia TaxID=4863 RepID=A0A9W8G3V0_9FUNG|nr:hypothetical protein EDC05_005001 [Coemansia umbellata]KAJ2672491.1 hypothetical protein GGI25_005094 [Coemansia spiralis]
MDIKALLETPHRSVHWAFINRLVATTASACDPEKRFAEWKKLITLDVATKAPHVFTEAIAQITQFTLTGRLAIMQVVQALTDLVAPSDKQKTQNIALPLSSAVCNALVQLLIAGGDSLAFKNSKSARDNILRMPLERNPSLFMPVLQNIRNSVCVLDSGPSNGNESGFDSKWSGLSRVLRYAVIDPTVPAWAQSQTLSMLFDVVRELVNAGSERGYSNAVTVLDWIVETGLVVVQPPESKHVKSSALYLDVDSRGRWSQTELVIECTRVVELVCACVVSNNRTGSDSHGAELQKRIVLIIDRLRLMTASLISSGLSGDMSSICQANSPRTSHNKDALTLVLDRLLAVLYDSLMHSPVARLDTQQSFEHARVDMLIWVLSVTQSVGANTSAEQSNYLSVISRILRNKALTAMIPAKLIHIARLPLLSVAVNGFNQHIRSMALWICEDIDQTASFMVVKSAETIGYLQHTLANMASSSYVFGLLPLLFSGLDNYLSVYSAVYAQRNTNTSRSAALDSTITHMDKISYQAFLLAPFLFEWDCNAADSNGGDVLWKLALSNLLQLLPKYPCLRLDLLPLFMYLLRYPTTPTTLRQALILHAVPSLATTKDAYATSRVVSVVSQLWSQSKAELPAFSSSGSVSIGCKEGSQGQMRLHCLAVRAWAEVVTRNPRVWRDLKPVIVQFIESRKVSVASKVSSSHVLDPEYEWTILMTIRGLVLREPDRYADEMLPFVYSLLTYARNSLSTSSTAILLDIACICVEARMADVRNVWKAILAAQTEIWLAKVDRANDLDAKVDAAENAAPVLNSLAKFLALIATHGDGSELYAAFRLDTLLRYVGPMCGLFRSVDDDVENPEPNSAVSADFFNVLPSRSRNVVLRTLSAFPIDDIRPLISGRTPAQIVHELLVLATQQLSSEETVGFTECSGGLAGLLSVLMDNEVRFMRRSFFSGSSTFARNVDDSDSYSQDKPVSHNQKRVWAQSNFERSQWINEILAPILFKAKEMYWNRDSLKNDLLASGSALANMVIAEVDLADLVTGLSFDAAKANYNKDDASNTASSTLEQTIAKLRLLIADIKLSDHWCLHNIAVDTWQIWFSKVLWTVQSQTSAENSDNIAVSVESNTTSAAPNPALVRAASHKFFSALQSQLITNGIPAHTANALLALAGLVKAAWSIDQVLGSELYTFVARLFLDHDILPFNQTVDDFWPHTAATRNSEVLAAAVECAGSIAACRDHDIVALSQVTQFLMAGLTHYSAAGLHNLSPLVVYALSRSLMHLHLIFSSQKADARTFSEESMVVEADDIRRCIERLNILQPKQITLGDAPDTFSATSTIDIGNIGLAIGLAAMHRRWIANLINPAMAEHNATPRAVQAQRTVELTLDQAYRNVVQAGNGEWNPLVLASLYYLSFVWPPRPITQRHIELHKDLFIVTPDRVWQTTTRLVRRLWGSMEDGDSIDKAHNVDLINHIEIASSTLIYHLTMTISQSAAQTTHLRLVQQYSEWARGKTEGMERQLAADEKSNLRTNRIVALAILLGIPMHGVPETTVSNEYLPQTQQKKLPVLLGIGSVQYGSTAWLRMSESTLQHPLGSLLSCSGIAHYLDPDEALSASDQTKETHQAITHSVEIDDARVAHISSFVLGGLFAQTTRAMYLLIPAISDTGAAVVKRGASTSGKSAHQSVKTKEGGLLQDTLETSNELAESEGRVATAMDEEPKSLGHLPAPTSWCRAVWESIGDLSGSLMDSEGSVAQIVESKLSVLLLAILKMARPFPVVDVRSIFGNVLYTYTRQLDSGKSHPTRLPLVLLLVKVSNRLGPISYSASQFLMDSLRNIISSTVSVLSSVEYLADEFTAANNPNSLVCIALSCLGDIGLGSILRLAGFTRGQQSNRVEDLNADITQLFSAETICIENRLKYALESTLPPSLEHSAVTTKEGVVESDAERMFRLMSKVRIQDSVAANLCAELLSCIFSCKRIASDSSEHYIVLALQIGYLTTLEEYISSQNISLGVDIVAKNAAREKITSNVAKLLDSDTMAEASDSERDLLLQKITTITSCGANFAKGVDLLSKESSSMNNPDYSKHVYKQATVLQRWITEAMKSGKDIAVDKAVSAWLKQVFKEWGQRSSSSSSSTINANYQGSTPSFVWLSERIAKCLQRVAMALFSRANSAKTAKSSANTTIGLCKLIIQGFDMAILALSNAAASQDNVDRNETFTGNSSIIVANAISFWLLPLLTGQTPSSSSSMLLSPFVMLASGEMVEYIDLASRHAQYEQVAGASTEDVPGKQLQQFAVQLRTRILRLLELTVSSVAERALLFVLSNLAILGMFPSSELSSIV